MREISQVVAPRLITQGNGPKVIKTNTTTKWNKVLPPATSATEPIVLRPYQIEAVQSVGNPSVGARIVADEMRVGKTATAIGIDFQARADLFYRDKRKCGNNCTLIVCPKKVLGVWSDHLIRMGVDRERIITIDLPSRANFKTVLRQIASDKRLKNRVGYYVILNWDSVQLLEKELLSCGPWFHIIADEIHRIKSRDTKRTVAFKHLPAKQKTGLTGTPADNKPEDFWSPLNWIDSKQFSSFWDFVDSYCTTQTNKSGYKYVTGTKESAMSDLHSRLSPFYIRRLLSDVSDYLPAKTFRTELIPMGRKQRTDYTNMMNHRMADLDGELLEASIKVVELVYLQQFAIGVTTLDENGKPHVDPNQSPKISWVVDYVKDQDEPESIVIVAQRPEVINGIAERLREAGVKSSVVTGDTNPRDTTTRIADFQCGKSKTFLGTIQAVKEGIDLSVSSTIIVVDRDWNPSTMEQVTSRCDAVNKVTPVEIIYLESEDSIDQYRTAKIDSKGTNIKLMIGDK